MAIEGSLRGRGGIDAGDHPPLTPTKALGPEELTGIHWKVYELVTRHFLASIAADCDLEKSTAIVDIGGELFRMESKKVINPGLLYTFCQILKKFLNLNN